jgi:hypothetical protein
MGVSVEQTTTMYDAEVFTAGAAMPPFLTEIEVRCLQTPTGEASQASQVLLEPSHPG